MEIKKMIVYFIEYCESKQLRPKTIMSYKQSLDLFASWLKEAKEPMRVDRITDLVIRRYILDLQARGKYTLSANRRTEKLNCPESRGDYNKPISNITINNYLRNIRVFFLWMLDMEYIEKNPMKKIKLLPQERTPKEYLDDNEIKRLIKSMNKSTYHEYRDLIIMMLMLDTGTRIGETLSIEESQIDLLNRSILLPAHKTKGRKERTVFFSQLMVKELNKWIRFKKRHCEFDTKYVFPTERTGRMVKVTQYGRNLRQYVKRVGIDKHISPHTFRNNFAKRCLLSGMDIYTLSRILGHSSVKVTERNYLDVLDTELKGRYQQHSPMDKIFDLI